MKLRTRRTLALSLLGVLGLVTRGLAEDISRYVVEKDPVIAFTQALLIDGTGAAPLANRTVIIANGRITQIARDGAVQIPEGARVIPLAGKALLPGWVALHEHLFHSTTWKDPFVANDQPVSFPKLYLAAGVTSARTGGSVDPYADLGIKRGIADGTSVGPDFDLTAPYLEGHPPALPQLRALASAEDAREHVRFWAGRGFTSFKAYMHIQPDHLRAAVDEAHRLGLKITAHLCSVTYREAAEMGIDQIEHGFLETTDFIPDKAPGQCDSMAQVRSTADLAVDDKRVQSLFAHLIKHDVTLTSTLATYSRMYGMLPPLDASEIAFMDKNSVDNYHESMERTAKDASSPVGLLLQQMTGVNMALEAAFWRAGGRLTIGSDAVPPGSIAGNEDLTSMELLVKAGIPPLNVIQIATENGAKAMGLADDRGTIAVGKRADLLIIDGNPATDIGDIRKIQTVFKNGVGYDPVALRKSVMGLIGGPGVSDASSAPSPHRGPQSRGN